MIRRTGRWPTPSACVVGLCVLVASSVARAADDDKFTLELAPYAWLAGIGGTLGAKGFTTHVSLDMRDILNDTDSVAGLFGRAEAHVSKFGLYIDGGYVKLGVDNLTTRRGFGNASLTQNMGIADFGLMYRVIDLPTTTYTDRLTMDAYVGGRYWHMGLSLDTTNFGIKSGTQDWIDPIVGVRVTANFGRHVQAIIGGDIGGFGAASEFTWSAVGTVGYMWMWGKCETSAFVGYKAIFDNYTTGSGFDKFTWDAGLYGPLLGMSFKF